VDWRIKGRLLAMGCILIVLGLVLYFARGVEATLALVAIGIVLLIVGVLWKPRKKKTENVNSDAIRTYCLTNVTLLFDLSKSTRATSPSESAR
jgi:membrane-bound ClpP family serine protease